MIRPNDTGGGVPLYQLKITLKGSRPPIWRRVLVRADIRLDRLHHVIQGAMGWENDHLHQFGAGGDFYGIVDPELEDRDFETLDETEFRLSELVPGARCGLMYEYDFGDGWEHEVAVERALPPDLGFRHPVCLGGANARPPEDCGGIGGYRELLGVLADPAHPEHADMKEWVGGMWDPARFDLEAVNRALKRLKT